MHLTPYIHQTHSGAKLQSSMSIISWIPLALSTIFLTSHEPLSDTTQATSHSSGFPMFGVLVQQLPPRFTSSPIYRITSTHLGHTVILHMKSHKVCTCLLSGATHLDMANHQLTNNICWLQSTLMHYLMSTPVQLKLPSDESLKEPHSCTTAVEPGWSSL